MIQNFPQPQFVFSIIAIPIRNDDRPAGAKSFSPTIAAWRATIAISCGSFLRSAMIPRSASRKPPPTQTTAKVTWTALKSAYQLSQSRVRAKIATTIATIATQGEREVAFRERTRQPVCRRSQRRSSQVQAAIARLRHAASHSSTSGSSPVP